MKVNHLETIKRLLDEIKDKDRVIEVQHNVISDLRAKVFSLEIPRLGIYVENMKGDQFYCPHCKMDAFCTNPDCTSNHFETRHGMSQEEIDVLLAVCRGETQPQAPVVAFTVADVESHLLKFKRYVLPGEWWNLIVAIHALPMSHQAPVVEVPNISEAVEEINEARMTVLDSMEKQSTVKVIVQYLDNAVALLQSKGG